VAGTVVDVDENELDRGGSRKAAGIVTLDPALDASAVARARRSIAVDDKGRQYVTADIPLDVNVASGTITVGSVTAVVSVALDGTGGTPDTVGVVDAAGDRMGINPDGSVPVATGLLKPIGAYDYVELVYTGANLTTVRYRAGGVAGSIVATLTLSYTGANLTGVART
jgi:hypothetical protein